MADAQRPPIEVRWMIDTDHFHLAMAESLRQICGDALEKWFNVELGKALRVLIVEDGIVDIDFDDVEPSIKFWADACQIDELTCSTPLAGIVETMIETWGSDIDDDTCGPDLRNKLRRLRVVLSEAVRNIDATLLPYGER